MSPPTTASQKSFTVQELMTELSDRLELKLVAGQGGLTRRIFERDLNRPSLALAGYFGDFRYDRIQILGNTENHFLGSLAMEERADRISEVFHKPLPLVILTDKNQPLKEILQAAELNDVPVVTTPLSTTALSSLLGTALDERFAPTIQEHGVLVDVYGVGVLIVGKARAGKSELAMDLIERGHRLVADDIVEISLRMGGVLMGQAPELLKHLIEVRGLGFLDVQKLFGVRAVRLHKRVEIVLELVHDMPENDVNRLGTELIERGFLGVNLPLVQLPVLPGKYLTVLAELVALNYLLRVQGINTAEEFAKRQQEEIEKKRTIRKFLEGDFE